MDDQISRITILGSPYEQSENDTKDEWYERYKLDPTGIIELDGRVFYRIISKAILTTAKGKQLLCGVDRRIWDNAVGHTLIDENGKRFKCCSFVQMCFRRKIPDWYFEAPEYVLEGEDIQIGEYLALDDSEEIN